jgi:hypothetical protein
VSAMLAYAFRRIFWILIVTLFATLNDITVAKDGTVYAAYADGCITAACIAKGNNSTASHTRFDNDGASKATIIKQTGGRGLFKNK